MEERNSVTKPEFRLKQSFKGKASPIPVKKPDVTRNPMHPQRFGTLVEAVLLLVHIREKRTTEGRGEKCPFLCPSLVDAKAAESFRNAYNQLSTIFPTAKQSLARCIKGHMRKKGMSETVAGAV